MDIFKGGDGNMNDEANNVNRQQRNADNKQIENRKIRDD